MSRNTFIFVKNCRQIWVFGIVIWQFGIVIGQFGQKWLHYWVLWLFGSDDLDENDYTTECSSKTPECSNPKSERINHNTVSNVQDLHNNQTKRLESHRSGVHSGTFADTAQIGSGQFEQFWYDSFSVIWQVCWSGVRQSTNALTERWNLYKSYMFDVRLIMVILITIVNTTTEFFCNLLQNIIYNLVQQIYCMNTNVLFECGHNAIYSLICYHQ
jgi:hypothetical protein